MADLFDSLAFWWLIACGLLLARADLRHRRLPTLMVLVLLCGLVVLHSGAVLAGADRGSWGWAALGLSGFAGVLVVVRLVVGDGLGGGDVRLAAPLGWWLGWTVGSQIVAAVAWTLVGACVAVLVGALVRRSGQALPFGPPLLVATVVVGLVLG